MATTPPPSYGRANARSFSPYVQLHGYFHDDKHFRARCVLGIQCPSITNDVHNRTHTHVCPWFGTTNCRFGESCKNLHVQKAPTDRYADVDARLRAWVPGTDNRPIVAAASAVAAAMAVKNIGVV